MGSPSLRGKASHGHRSLIPNDTSALALERRVGVRGQVRMQCLRLLSDRKREMTADQAKRCDFDNGVEVTGLEPAAPELRPPATRSVGAALVGSSRNPPSDTDFSVTVPRMRPGMCRTGSRGSTGRDRDPLHRLVPRSRLVEQHRDHQAITPFSCHKRAIHSGISGSLRVAHEVQFVPLTWAFARTCWSGV